MGDIELTGIVSEFDNSGAISGAIYVMPNDVLVAHCGPRTTVEDEEIKKIQSGLAKFLNCHVVFLYGVERFDVLRPIPEEEA